MSKLALTILGAVMVVIAVFSFKSHKSHENILPPADVATVVNKDTSISGPIVSGPSNEKSSPAAPAQSTKPKSTGLKSADVVVPDSDEEQQHQIDQNTIKNVEQDSRLDQHDSDIDDLNDEIDNINNNQQNPMPDQDEPPAQSPAPEPIIKCAVSGQFGDSNTLVCKNTHDSEAKIKSITFSSNEEAYVEFPGFSKSVDDGTTILELSQKFDNIPVGGNVTQITHWQNTVATAISLQVEVAGELITVPVTYQHITSEF